MRQRLVCSRYTRPQTFRGVHSRIAQMNKQGGPVRRQQSQQVRFKAARRQQPCLLVKDEGLPSSPEAAQPRDLAEFLRRIETEDQCGENLVRLIKYRRSN